MQLVKVVNLELQNGIVWYISKEKRQEIQSKSIRWHRSDHTLDTLDKTKTSTFSLSCNNFCSVFLILICVLAYLPFVWLLCIHSAYCFPFVRDSVHCLPATYTLLPGGFSSLNRSIKFNQKLKAGYVVFSFWSYVCKNHADKATVSPWLNQRIKSN